MSAGPGGDPGSDARSPGAGRILLGILAGAAWAVGSGLLAYVSLLGMFQLLSDTGGTRRPMSPAAAWRFLVANAALALGHVLVLVIAFRRWKGLAFRIPLLALGLAALGVLFLNPFTQCAVDAVRR